MKTHVFGNEDGPSLMLLPGLGVSYEIFLPLISLLKNRFHIVAVEVDGFILGEHSRFTSIDDQAGQAIEYVKEHFDGRLDCAYGLSMGGKILSRMLERDEITIEHAVLDGYRHTFLARDKGGIRGQAPGKASSAPSSLPAGRSVRRNEPRAASGRQAAGSR